MLGNDFVINENYCNQKCQYCLTGESNIKQSHKDKLIFKKPKIDTYSPESKLGKDLNTIVQRVLQKFKTPLLKVSGGEIFLIKGITDFIEKIAMNHSVIVVQTNGVLVDSEYLYRLKIPGNIVIQISLDSHLHFGNSYRIQRKDLHKRAIKRISKIIESGLPVEIYSVLTDRSVTQMNEFAAWLLKFDNRPLYFPYPVRGPNSDRFQVRPEQFKYIERFLESFGRYSSVLPPEQYFKRLLNFYQESGRHFRCYLPLLVLSTFSDGILTACPNIWFNNMGNLLEDDWEKAGDKVGNTGLYTALLGSRPRLKACRSCYTPWDLLTLYFDDEITLDDLLSSPLYRPEAVQSVIERKKAQMNRFKKVSPQ